MTILCGKRGKEKQMEKPPNPLNSKKNSPELHIRLTICSHTWKVAKLMMLQYFKRKQQVQFSCKNNDL
jgi:hypothetical protein